MNRKVIPLGGLGVDAEGDAGLTMEKSDSALPADHGAVIDADVDPARWRCRLP